MPTPKRPLTVLRRLPLAATALIAGLGIASAQPAAAAPARSKPKQQSKQPRAKKPQRVFACFDARRGRLVPARRRARCRRGQTKVGWVVNARPPRRGQEGKKGPEGKKGDAGPRGPAGPQGPRGAIDAATLDALTARLDRLEQDNAALRQRVEALEGTLAGVSREGDTLTFSRMNVALVNGLGRTDSTNGLGNLFVGYNAGPGAQTGSHVLAIGDQHSFTSWGGLVAGSNNTLAGDTATVVGGDSNVATAKSVVVGGASNEATDVSAVVVGGFDNAATAAFSGVVGGGQNVAAGAYSSILGGHLVTIAADAPHGIYPSAP